jgi:hypothetical protein
MADDTSYDWYDAGSSDTGSSTDATAMDAATSDSNYGGQTTDVYANPVELQDGSTVYKQPDGSYVDRTGSPVTADGTSISNTGGTNTGGGMGAGAATDPFDKINSWLKTLTPAQITAGGAGIGALLGMLGQTQANRPPSGYQGGITKQTAVRSAVPASPAGITAAPRKYGAPAQGHRYFSDMSYAPASDAAAIAAAKAAADKQAQEIAAAQAVHAAGGGLMSAAKGTYLRGDTDGMADKLSTTIGGHQPAALSHGEFVIPADVVSHLGNGNSDAGAKKLYHMMDKVRMARTGTKKQGRQINPDKFMPGGSVGHYASGGITGVPTAGISALANNQPTSNRLNNNQNLGGTSAATNIMQTPQGFRDTRSNENPVTIPWGGNKGLAPWVTAQNINNVNGNSNLSTNPADYPDYKAPPPPVNITFDPRTKTMSGPNGPITNPFNNHPTVVAGSSPPPTLPSFMNVPRGETHIYDKDGNDVSYLIPRSTTKGPSPHVSKGYVPKHYASGGITGVQRFADGGTTLPAGTTGTESNLSNWVGPYVTDMLGRAQGLADQPYQAYTGPLTAGASDLQTQAFNSAKGLTTPTSIGTAANTANKIATDAAGASYDPTKFNNLYTAPTAFDPTKFTSGEFGSTDAQKYMNPYLQTSLDPQLKELQRQNQIANMNTNSKLTQAGAFGGSRQAVMNAENQRDMLDKTNSLVSQGYNTAYDKAISQYNAERNRQLDVEKAQEAAKQYGYDQSMTAADLMAKYGMSAAEAQEKSKQYAADYRMTGLKTGLDAANTASNIGKTQNDTNIANINAQANLGAQDRGIESEALAADKAQFEEERANPYKMLQYQQSILQGLPLAAQNYNVAQPNMLTNAAGGATTLANLLATLGYGTPAATTPAK